MGTFVSARGNASLNTAGANAIQRKMPIPEPANGAGYVFDRTNPRALVEYIELLRSCEIRNLGQPLSQGYHELGGKNAGLLLLQKLLIDNAFGNEIEGVSLSIPSTYMLGSSFYFAFLESNPELGKMIGECCVKSEYGEREYAELKKAFLSASMPQPIKNELVVLLQKTSPSRDFFMVRSSASCEDGILPSAGLFETVPFYNGRDMGQEELLENLESCLKTVYASLFSPSAMGMMRRADLDPQMESMPVTIQPVVGNWYGGCFFPFLSGVVKSTNSWPWGHEIRREDPVGRVGLGLGTLMVGDTGSFKQGGPRIFSFGEEGGLSQFVGTMMDPESMHGGGGHPIATDETQDYGQTKIDVLKVENGRAVVRTLEWLYNPLREDNGAGVASNMPYCLRDIMASHVRGTDKDGGRSIYERYDAIELPNNIRGGFIFDIGKLVRNIMDRLRHITGESVSFEFAVAPASGTDGRRPFVFNLLQVRPQTANVEDREIPMADLSAGNFTVLAKSDSGVFGHLDEKFDCVIAVTPKLLESVGKRRARELLREADNKHRGKYLLIGPEADAFVSGTGGFEIIYGSLSPGAVISLKHPAEIRNLAAQSGSHTADNIERAPVMIVNAEAASEGLNGLLEEFDRRLEGGAIGAESLIIGRSVHVQLDGTRGHGQIYLQE